MSLNTIYINNTGSDCNSTIIENVITTECTNYIVRLNPNSKAYGPFDIVVVNGVDYITYSGITVSELKNGVEIPLNCS
jgi:hypothetical protein